MKTSIKDAVSVNSQLSRDFRSRKTVTSLKVSSKHIDTDQESSGSSSEDMMEYYSPKSVVSMMMTSPKDANGHVFRSRFPNPILRIRCEDSQIGEDIGEGLVCKLAGNDRIDFDQMFSRPASPLGGKTTSSLIKSEN